MTRPSDNFLRAFRAAGATGKGLEVISDDAEGFAEALAHDPEGFGQAMEDASDLIGGSASVPVSAFAAAACRRDGRIVAADSAFEAFDLPTRSLAKAFSTTDVERPHLSSVVDDANGRPVALAVALPARALAWPLSPKVREALTSGAADYGVMGVGSSDGADWAALFSPWTFSGPETRLAGALVRLGDLREAAAEVGVAYETARETLAAAMAKTGARKQPDFVRQLAQLAFGDLPVNDATWRTLADAYGLSDRQARLALLVAFGATRARAADALGISDNTAKADLKLVYDICGIDSGAQLGRIIAETDALSRLAQATDVEILRPGHVTAPLRFVRRTRAPGRIAVEDHGPLSGVPVIAFHTPINGRHLPRRLVAAMQARGLRPISLERPGYGLTTPSDGDVAQDANADLIDVLNALGIDRVRLLGRSLSMPLHFAAAHPERVQFGVLLGGAPPGSGRGAQGLLAMAIGLALDNPQLVQAFAKFMTRISSEASILRSTEGSLKNSPADMAAIADPTNRADWIKSCRQSSKGDGFGRELVLHADGRWVPASAYRADWTILMGGEDALIAGVADPQAEWKAAVPHARVQLIADCGRLLHLSHPDLVAEALAR